MSTSLLVLLTIALLTVAAKVCGSLAARAALPTVLGELLAGLLLGPTFLNFWHWSIFDRAGSGVQTSLLLVFKVLADLGVVLLMTQAGLETDIPMLRRAAKPAFWAAGGGIVLPMALGTWGAHWAGFSWASAIFVGTILTATSVTITAQTLQDLGHMRSRAGSTILGAAVCDDVLGLIVLSIVIALVPHFATAGSMDLRTLGWTVARLMFTLLLLAAAGPLFTRLVFQRARHLRTEHATASAALFVAFLLAFLAEWLGGMAAITGAYLAGLFIAQQNHQQEVLRETRPAVMTFFAPLFFVSIGLEADLGQLKGHWLFFLALLAIAIGGKIVGAGMAVRACGFPTRESLAVGVGMIPRGEVGLITANLGFTAGLVSRDLYVLVVLVVIATTLVTPGLLRYCFPRK